MQRILITGATGYIGRRLLETLLLRQDLSLRLLVRNKRKLSSSAAAMVEIVEGDTFSPEALADALQDIDTAYYLIHSMGSGKDYRRLDLQSAENFREACILAGVKRLIYLGGLGRKETASKHLLSRLETGEILSARPEVQCLWFRAGVIIGSGSASFEIIRNLVEKLPVLVTPRWVKTRSQPISVEDVLAYLVAAIDLKHSGNLVIDLGAEPMTFKEMLLETAAVLDLRRLLLPVPAFSPRLSSYWLILFTPVPFKIASALVEGLKSETLAANDNSAVYFPAIRPMSFRDAVRLAIREMEYDQVISRWCDSSAGSRCDIVNMDEPRDAILHDRREVVYSGISGDAVFRSACAVGGDRGWYVFTFLWQVRGLLDKLLGGYGLSRGRRISSELRIGDALDFWKVADIRPGKRLLLLAQMKLPGKAWLEFEIHDDRLIQTAHFSPSGLWGRLYWYLMWPLHQFVFTDLARQIVAHAAGRERQD